MSFMPRYRIYLPSAELRTIPINIEAANASEASERANTLRIGAWLKLRPRAERLETVYDSAIRASERVA